MTAKAKSRIDTAEEFHWPFGKTNYLIFGAALVAIIIGYITLAQGSMTLAPILLVLGYCVLIPLSLLIRSKDVDSGESIEAVEAAIQADDRRADA
jgi:hypothetical protein